MFFNILFLDDSVWPNVPLVLQLSNKSNCESFNAYEPRQLSKLTRQEYKEFTVKELPVFKYSRIYMFATYPHDMLDGLMNKQ